MKKPIEKMAEFIINSSAEHCKECCADFERCEAEMRRLCQINDDVNYTPPMPSDEHCIVNIIKYFEKEVETKNE